MMSCFLNCNEPLHSFQLPLQFYCKLVPQMSKSGKQSNEKVITIILYMLWLDVSSNPAVLGGSCQTSCCSDPTVS